MAQDQSAQTQALNSYSQSVLALTQLLNLPSPEGFMLLAPATEPDDGILSLTPEEIYHRALETNRGVQAEQDRLLGNKKNERIMKSAFYPQLSLSLGINTGYYNIAGSELERFGRQWKNNLNKSVAFTLSIPLFNRLDGFRRLRVAKLQTQDQELVVDGRKQELYKDIQHAYYNAVASKEKYLSSEVSGQATAELLSQLKEKYALGRVSTYELNEVRIKWTKADMERIQAKYEYEFNVRILERYLK